MSDHERDQAAAAALGALSPEEAARLAADAAGDPALSAELEEYRATVAMLEASVARESAPPGLFDAVLARIEDESTAPAAVAAPAPARLSLRERVAHRFWPAFAAGAAAAAAALAIAFVVASDDSLGSPDARAAVQGTQEFSDVSGEARLYASTQDDGRLVLHLSELPSPSAGEHYEVWVLRREAEGEMEAVGVFVPTSATVDLEFRLPGPGDYEAVDVSVEPDGGPAEHSGRSLAGGKFESGV
ncbi:MAG TPA: anti-sigma factor [Gaiellaceae bacterium]|nr:anti-sigma factor [Gaiellaceae bacterium]